MRLLEAIAQAAAVQLSCLINGEQPAGGYIPALSEAISGALAAQAPKGETRFERLVEKAEQPELYIAVLTLCIAEAVNRDCAAALSPFGGPTLQLAAQLTGRSCPLDRMRTAYRQLSQLLEVKLSSLPFFRHPFSADERLLCYLTGDDELDIRLKADGVQLIPPGLTCPPIYARQALLKRLEASLYTWEQSAPLIQLAGEEGSGRRFLVRQACHTANLPLLLVDYRAIAGRSLQELRAISHAVRREAMLSRAGVCFVSVNGDTCHSESELRAFERDFLQTLYSLNTPIFVCTDHSTQLIALLSRYVERLDLPVLHRDERIALWQGYCGELGLSGMVDCEAAGSKFHLTPLEICKAVKRLAHRFIGTPFSEAEVSSACNQVLPPPASGSIKLIDARYTLDDLKLPDEQKRKLLNICSHVRHQRLVYDQWAMESRYAYGKNVSALFVGPPGTGKTMAAHALSTELNIPLYRIDLSQVVDKYIGETEKRLEEIFAAAEKSNTILFFDEADAIFGKRSEVNDAKDKYANTEVSYILQRIEQYDGIVLLATNYKKNIDEAFMRRMRYLVEFQLPGEAQRLEIWQYAFAPEVPLQDIDFGYLARQFELSGGAIKNIALNAAFLAADEGHPVTMKNILDSIRGENLKMGKAMLKQDFAEYGALY